MKPTLALAALAAAFCIAPAFAQTSRPTSVKIEGHIVKPKEIPPTDDLIAKNIKLPDGFKIGVFAKDLKNSRMLAVNPANGDVYVTRREQGDLLLLKDSDKDGKADSNVSILQRPQLHGLTIDGDKMYLVSVKMVWVADIQPDGTLANVTRIIEDLPDAGQHPNRTIAVGPDKHLYISVGSTCNECHESNVENATMLRASLDGKSRTIYASGLRNTIGFGWHKASGRFWGMDHGIDWLGNDEQPEEVNELKQGKVYGWPYVYFQGTINPHQEPAGKVSSEEWQKMSVPAVLGYRAHSAPMQLSFYDQRAFPKQYQGGAFIAMRGSWNRQPPSGYEIAYITFDEAGNATKIEPFATGWLQKQEGDTYGHMGRLCGTAVAADGSLLVTDDRFGTIYRISYDGATASTE